MLLRVTSINRSGLGIYSAASIVAVLSQAACGSYSGSERGNAAAILLGLTTGSTKDLTIGAFLGDADGGMGRPRAEA
jgi:hypothetical protein